MVRNLDVQSGKTCSMCSSRVEKIGWEEDFVLANQVRHQQQGNIHKWTYQLNTNRTFSLCEGCLVKAKKRHNIERFAWLCGVGISIVTLWILFRFVLPKELMFLPVVLGCVLFLCLSPIIDGISYLIKPITPYRALWREAFKGFKPKDSDLVETLESWHYRQQNSDIWSRFFP